MPNQSLSQKKTVAIIAGESSGDILAAALMAELKLLEPNVFFEGIGGDNMAAIGFKSLYPMERLSVMGIGAILKRLPELLKLRKTLKQRWTQTHKPDLFIGIDAPEFNIGLELSLKKFNIKTLHYVSPSVWAWRPKRIFKIKKAVDHMLTLFPFENSIYQQHKINVTCVGHVMAQKIPSEVDPLPARQSLNLTQNDEVLAMLPGSRGSELKFLAPLFLAVVDSLLKSKPDLKILVPMANQRCRHIFEEILKTDTLQHNLKDNLTLIDGNSREIMTAADVVLLASGTATLEAALLKKPMVMAYKVSRFSYAIFRRLSILTYYALPNLLLNKRLVPEYLQDEATLENLSVAVLKQFNMTKDDKQILMNDYEKIHHDLQCGGSIKAASIAQTLLLATKQDQNLSGNKKPC